MGFCKDCENVKDVPFHNLVLAFKVSTEPSHRIQYFWRESRSQEECSLRIDVALVFLALRRHDIGWVHNSDTISGSSSLNAGSIAQYKGRYCNACQCRRFEGYLRPRKLSESNNESYNMWFSRVRYHTHQLDNIHAQSSWNNTRWEVSNAMWLP